MKLIELLCVAAIVGILASMLLPSVQKPDKLNNLKFSNHWRNFKIESIMNDDLSQEAFENILKY